jgi:hypothetical protein
MSVDAKVEEAEPGRLLKATSVVSSMTLLSRVSGLARDISFAHWFGAGIVMDAFFVAFKIPNLLRRFFAEGAFSQAFVPVISEYKALSSQRETQELLDNVTGTLALVLFGITAVGVAAAPVVIMLFAPGFLGGDGRYEVATAMLRFTFPYLFFISLTALAGGILNTYRRFAVPAFTPVLLNLVLIAFAAWVAPRMEQPAMALALGVFVAGAVQLLFQLPFLVSLKVLPRPRWGWAHEGVRRILKLMLPVMFGSSVAQINLLFDTLIASFLAAGSISWLYYSDRLMEFPLGVCGIAVATVMLPHLSEHHAKAAPEAFSASLDWALRLVVVIAVPATPGRAAVDNAVLRRRVHGKGRHDGHGLADRLFGRVAGIYLREDTLDGLFFPAEHARPGPYRRYGARIEYGLEYHFRRHARQGRVLCAPCRARAGDDNLGVIQRDTPVPRTAARRRLCAAPWMGPLHDTGRRRERRDDWRRAVGPGSGRRLAGS